MTRMLSLAFLLALTGTAMAQDSDPDRKKTSMALLLEGLRAEEGKPANLVLAIAKYKKSAVKAKEEKNDAVGAEALGRQALANEHLDPENIAEAQTAWGEITSAYSGVKPWGDRAVVKSAAKGVDVWLGQLHVFLDSWRLTADRSPLAPALEEKKKVFSDKILALDKDAVAGLLAGLAHPDDVIRDFAAGLLGHVIDEAGITAVVSKLNDPNPLLRAGASSTLQKVYQKYNEAAELDRRASELERDLSTVTLQAGSKAEGQHKKLQEEAAKLKTKASEIRKNVPPTLATADIQGALQKIIEDEGALCAARREAALAAMKIGRISGGLVDALLKGMDSKDRNVREACCRAGGGVDTALSGDKHKLADRLIKAVQDEPAKAEDSSAADWANDEAVRQAAAEALEHVVLVKSLPALIEALDDNDVRVRTAAFRALNLISRKDFEYEKDDKGLAKTYEADKPLEERRKAQAKWKEWWDQTKGVVVLVERFHTLQANWSQTSAVSLFEPAFVMRDVESRKWSVADPKIDEDRAKRVIEDFQRRKDVFVQDAVDLGVDSADQFLKFIGGETDRDAGKANAATRYFVAEVLARIIDKNSAAAVTAKVRDLIVSGDSPAKKTGAAIALGFLPKDKVADSEREALSVKGLGAAEADVKEAAANALGKVGTDGSAADLTKTAQDSDAKVQIAALRALSLIHPKNADTVKVLSDMVADEPDQIGGASKRSAHPLVRENAVDALGSIGDAAATPALLRARRDLARNVREAATIAIQKVHKADAKTVADEATKVLLDEKRKTDDRSGAALLLGDTGDAAQAKQLSERIIDLNPPRVLKDADAGVRIKICEALGNLKAKTKTSCGRLLSVIADDNEREAVRHAAYQALCSIFAINPAQEGSADKDKAYVASQGKDARTPVVQKWTEYLNGQSLQD